jgi:hypothetical protein
MRILLAACTVTTAGLIAASTLGVASAETTPTTPTTTTPAIAVPRTVSVEGVANEAIEQSASPATATAVYRQGMADAIADGLAKAQFLAGKTGATVGAVQSVAEGSGEIDCAGEEEYLGAQPDFGSGSSGTVVPLNRVAAGTARPPKVSKPKAKHPKKHRNHVTAKKAAAANCTLSTQVSLSYLLN